MVSLRGCPKCTGGGVGRVHVDYAAMLRSFKNGQQIGHNIQDLARGVERRAIQYAPRRSGKMKKAHYRVVQPPRGMTRNFFVGNKMGYAFFVQHGTKNNGAGYIYPRPPRRVMELRPVPYSMFSAADPRRFQERVHGQEANNWLNRAMKDAVLSSVQFGSRFGMWRGGS